MNCCHVNSINTANTPARVVLLDDHPMILYSITQLVSSWDGFEVVLSTSDPALGLEKALQLDPDIIVTDIKMPGVCIFSLLSQFGFDSSRAKIIFLSAYSSNFHFFKARKLGAAGFLCKSEEIDQLKTAFEAVLSGQNFYSDRFQKESRFLNAIHPLDRLSHRELEVLKLVCQGHSDRKISDILSISFRTVERHKFNMMEKLQIKDRVSLTRYAIQEGVFDPE